MLSILESTLPGMFVGFFVLGSSKRMKTNNYRLDFSASSVDFMAHSGHGKTLS